jgi:hypothetical protein
MGRVRSLSVLGGMDGEGRLSRLQMLGRGMRLLLHQPWLSGGRVLKVLRGVRVVVRVRMWRMRWECVLRGKGNPGRWIRLVRRCVALRVYVLGRMRWWVRLRRKMRLRRVIRVRMRVMPVVLLVLVLMLLPPRTEAGEQSMCWARSGDARQSTSTILNRQISADSTRYRADPAHRTRTMEPCQETGLHRTGLHQSHTISYYIMLVHT